MSLKLVRYCGNASCPGVPHIYRAVSFGQSGPTVCPAHDHPWVGTPVHELVGRVLRKRQEELSRALEEWRKEEDTVLEVHAGGTVFTADLIEVWLL